jgi:ribosomal protein S18 acetylase RimI-like enzyme
MTLDDYDAVIALMQETPGVSVRDADSREAVGRYLARNPELSFVACSNQEVVGCIMSGHDGRRGYLQHLVVREQCRRQGVGNTLVARCVDALRLHGIEKCHVDVFKTNALAADYWRSQGWTLRTDIDRYSYIPSGNANA